MVYKKQKRSVVCTCFPGDYPEDLAAASFFLTVNLGRTPPPFSCAAIFSRLFSPPLPEKVSFFLPRFYLWNFLKKKGGPGKLVTKIYNRREVRLTMCVCTPHRWLKRTINNLIAAGFDRMKNIILLFMDGNPRAWNCRLFSTVIWQKTAIRLIFEEPVSSLN